MAFSNLDVALAYARANLRVFPCGHGKLPLTAGNWLANATTDEKQIRTWWSASPSALIGLPMKPHDLLVFDADRHHDSEDGIAHFRALCAEHEPLPPHPIVLTANGGEHHIFRQPTNKIGNRKLGNGLETRGYKDHNDGGFIIAAGSRLPDGRSWRRAKDTPSLLNATLPEPPAWLAEYASEQKTEWKPNGGGDRHQASNREARYAEAALRNCAAELAAQRKPGRNNLLNVCALKMGAIAARGWISRPAVADAFYAACRLNRLAQEDGDDSVQKTLASGFEAGWARPHPDLEERQHDARKQSAKASEPKASAHDWDDPDWSILDDRRGEPPEFPLQVLSPKVQSLINRTAKGAGVTPAHVAVPMLGIVSSLIGIARRIETTSSWRQPMTCWTTVVGFSGTGKTPGLNVTKRCVKQVERDNKNSDDAKRRAYETKKESATAAREKWKKAVKDAIENNVPAPPMPVEASDPGKFIPPKLYVSDGTIERLGELLQARPQGILFLRDELSGLFTNMSRYSSGQDNEFWLEAWNGDSFNVERMGRVTHVDHLLIGIAGGMQPDKLVKSFEGDHDGMYSRVLFAWPTEPDCPVLSDEAVEIDPDIQNIIARINKLAELTAEGTLVIRDVPLSQEARKQFAQFAHREKDAFEGREREWFAKMTAHVLRLSGALTYLPWAMEGGPEPTTIDQGSMSSAIVLARDYFWPHARACLRQIGLTERHTNARRVLRWLKANHKTEVSREDVRRDALSQRLDADGTTELLATLCRSGWLREKASPQQATGRPPRRWSVNLKLFSPPTAETAETAETPTGAG